MLLHSFTEPVMGSPSMLANAQDDMGKPEQQSGRQRAEANGSTGTP